MYGKNAKKNVKKKGDLHKGHAYWKKESYAGLYDDMYLYLETDIDNIGNNNAYNESLWRWYITEGLGTPNTMYGGLMCNQTVINPIDCTIWYVVQSNGNTYYEKQILITNTICDPSDDRLVSICVCVCVCVCVVLELQWRVRGR